MNPYIRCLFLLLLLHELPAQSTYYVRQNASGANTGLSWSDAFTDLQSALAAAQKGDAIWVAGGVYAPTAGADRNISFEPRSGVKLYGGFAGTETALSQRDPGAHVTTLSGDIGDPADTTDNSYTILYLAYPDSSTLIDGFTFRHGYASSDTSFDYTSRVLCGAAVYVEARGGTGLPVFSGCRFLDNFAQGSGGAYFVSAANTKGSTPVFRHCEFRNNWAWQKGGAVYLAGGNSLDRGIEFEHCVFLQNRAWGPQGQGGAVCIHRNFSNEMFNFHNCKIMENSATALGGGLSVTIGGLVDVAFALDSCEIIRNRAGSGTGSGGYSVMSVYNLNFPDIVYKFYLTNSRVEGNYFLTPCSSPSLFLFEATGVNRDTFVIKSNHFIGNKCMHIGEFGSINSYTLIKENVLYGNLMPGRSGARQISAAGSTVLCLSNKIMNNEGASIEITRYNFISSDNGQAIVGNNLLLGNTATQNHLIKTLTHPNPSSTYPVRLYNNTLYGNRLDEFTNPNTPLQSYNDLKNNIILQNTSISSNKVVIPLPIEWDSCVFSYNLMDTDCADLPGLAVCGPGNIVASDPMFMDTAALDFRLQPCSPAVDAGSNAAALLAGLLEDFDGNPRILDGIVDMGAIESLMLALAAPPQTTPACNGLADGAVQFDLQNGCPPYSLQWTNGAQSGTEPEQLLPGAYQFTVTDQKGKVFETAVDIPGSAAFMAGASVQNAGGPATADGSISIYVQSGTGPFTFFWSTSDSTAGISGLLPGIYTVTITDGAGCIYTQEYEVKFTIGTGEPGEPAGWVYPNPAVSVVRLGFGPCDEWRLITPEGRVCRQAHRRASGEIVEIALQGLPPGIYAYRFQKSGQPAGQGKLAILPH